MPASSDMPAVGDKFATRDELTSCVFEYSQAHGHAFRVKRKDRNYLNFDCPEAECEWEVKTKWVEGECQVFGTAEHSCSPGERRGCDGMAEWVSRVLEEKVAAQFDYGPKQAATDLRTFRDYAVPKRTIERGLEMAKARVHGLLGEQYGMLAPYLTDLQNRNESVYWDVQKREDGAFQRLFWTFLQPASLDRLLPILCSDACSLTGPYGGCLYITVGVDAERHVVPLAYSVGNAEDKDGWCYHNTHLRVHYGEHLTRCVVFSDRQKGLEADTTLTEVVLHQALCVKHLVNNVVTQTKIPQRNASTVVWKLAKTEYREEAEQYLREIKQTYGPDTHKYLLETGLQRWSDAYWPENVPRWGTYTSNTAESVNAIFRETRQGSLLSVLKTTRCWTADTFAKRRCLHEEVEGVKPVPAVEKIVRKNSTEASSSAITLLSENVWEVRRTRSSVVRLQEGLVVCECPQYRRFNLPCTHAIKVLIHQGHNILTHSTALPSFAMMDNFRQFYSATVFPGELQHYVSDGTKPPVVKKGVGRRRKVRIRSNGEARALKCSNCGLASHNRRTCPIPPKPSSKPAAKTATKPAAKKTATKPAAKKTANKPAAKKIKRKRRRDSSESSFSESSFSESSFSESSFSTSSSSS